MCQIIRKIINFFKKISYKKKKPPIPESFSAIITTESGEILKTEDDQTLVK